MLNLLAAVFALFMLARHGRRALLFVAPSLVRVEGAAAAAPRTIAQVRVGDALATLGFVRLGGRREAGPLGGVDERTDAWGTTDASVYADVGERGEVTFVSPFASGAFVVTADHARVALDGPALQAGGLPGAALDAALAAHRIAVDRFRAAHGDPSAPPFLPARLVAARAWRAGPGRRELRRTCATSFASACIAVALLAGSVNLTARHLR